MLTKVQVGTPTGNLIDLTMLSEEISDSPFQIKNIEGLGPVKADINSTRYGSIDGESFTGSSIGKRNIVMTIGLNPNWVDETIESLRSQLYEFFMTKRQVILRFYSTHLPTVEISGYVESNEPNIFSKDPEMQVSVICPDPDFVSYASLTPITGVVDTDSSDPVIFDYDGTVPSGFLIKINSSVAQPSYTGNLNVYLTWPIPHQLQFAGTIDSTHRIEANTNTGSKRISQIPLPSGAYVNLIPSLLDASTWPVLQPGENRLAVVAASAGQTWEVTFDRRYGGI